eukprot:gene8980-biopygen16692
MSGIQENEQKRPGSVPPDQENGKKTTFFVHTLFGEGAPQKTPPHPQRDGRGRGPDAGHTMGFREANAGRTRTGRRQRCLSLAPGVVFPPRPAWSGQSSEAGLVRPDAARRPKGGEKKVERWRRTPWKLRQHRGGLRSDPHTRRARPTPSPSPLGPSGLNGAAGPPRIPATHAGRKALSPIFPKIENCWTMPSPP